MNSSHVKRRTLWNHISKNRAAILWNFEFFNILVPAVTCITFQINKVVWTFLSGVCPLPRKNPKMSWTMGLKQHLIYLARKKQISSFTTCHITNNSRPIEHLENKNFHNLECLKTRLDLEWFRPAFNKHACFKNAKGTKVRPLKMFGFCLGCLALLQGSCSLTAGLEDCRSNFSFKMLYWFHYIR